jgi:hypothetical protein
VILGWKDIFAQELPQIKADEIGEDEVFNPEEAADNNTE